MPRSLSDALREGARRPIPAASELALTLDQLRLPPIPLGQGKSLNIPGISDVLHLIPDSALDPDTRRFLNYERARRIRQDPTPHAARRVQEILTALDDIQDGAVTLSVFLRLAALRVPALRQPAIFTGAAADALTIESIVTRFQGLPRAGKRQVAAALRASPRYYRGRAITATTLAKALPNAPEILQVLQTSDTLLGWGISLGSLMAAPVAAFSAATHVVQQLEDDARSRAGLPPSAPRSLLGALAPPGYQHQAAEIQTRLGITAVEGARLLGRGAAAAWQVLRGWTTIQGQHQTLGLRDHAFALAALYAAAEYFNLVSPAHLSDGTWPSAIADVPITPPFPRSAVLLATLEDLGEWPPHEPRFPLPNEPTALTAADMFDTHRDLAADAVHTWRTDITDPKAAQAIGHLQIATINALYPALLGGEDAWQEYFSPEGRAFLGAMDYDLPAPPGSTPEQIRAYYDRIASVLDPATDDWPGPEDYEEALRVEFSSAPPA